MMYQFTKPHFDQASDILPLLSMRAIPEIVYLDRGMTLLSLDNASRHLHVLLDGWAMRCALLPAGRMHTSGIILAGDFADLDRLNGHELEAQIIAITKCRFARVSLVEVRAAMTDDSVICQQLLRIAIATNSALLTRNLALSCSSAQERVAQLLCYLAARLTPTSIRNVDWPIELIIPLTQDYMADLLGLSKVHLYRVLQGFSMDGLIIRAGKKFTILKLQRLSIIAETSLGRYNATLPS